MEFPTISRSGITDDNSWLFPEIPTSVGTLLTSGLVTYVWPVRSALSRLLSWLGKDLRSGDARDEVDERDRRSPEEWWWCREEEADGRVSDALETLPDSARLRKLEPPEELGRDRLLSRRDLSRCDDWRLGESCRLSSPCLHLRSGLLDLRRSDPWELGRPTAETLEASDLGWFRIQRSWLWFLSVSSWTIPWTWNAWKVVVSPLPERVSPQNRPWSLHWLSWLPSPPLRPCIDFSECWPWLAQPTPQATSPCKRDRVCLECKVVALHSDGIVGSEDGFMLQVRTDERDEFNLRQKKGWILPITGSCMLSFLPEIP